MAETPEFHYLSVSRHLTLVNSFRISGGAIFVRDVLNISVIETATASPILIQNAGFDTGSSTQVGNSTFS